MLRFTYRAFMLLLLGLSIAWAQTQNAQIAGTVTDPSGARVVDAEVVVTNVSTSVARTVVTGATGNYSVPNLTPGVYTVEVSAAGFQQAVSDLISLDVNQSATFDVELRVGSVAETVEVTAEGVQLESSTAQLGTVVTEEKIQELPLNGRNFTQLLTLTTGASPVSVGLNRGGAQIQQVGTFAFPAINGQHNRSKRLHSGWRLQQRSLHGCLRDCSERGCPVSVQGTVSQRPGRVRRGRWGCRQHCHQERGPTSFTGVSTTSCAMTNWMPAASSPRASRHCDRTSLAGRLAAVSSPTRPFSISLTKGTAGVWVLRA